MDCRRGRGPGTNATTATADHAGDFSRAAMLLRGGRAPNAQEPKMTDTKPGPPRRGGEQGSSMDRQASRDWVQVRERNGIWEVRVDGVFHGDYHQKEHALAAAAVVKKSTR